jgi:hypothetical protein
MWEHVLRVKTLRINGVLSPAVDGVSESHGGRGEGRTLTSDHVRDLDDGIRVGLGEDTLATSALNVEREDPQRSDVRPISLGGVRNERVVSVPQRQSRLRAGDGRTHSQSISSWQLEILSRPCRIVYVPLGSSSQFIPTIYLLLISFPSSL